MNVPRTGAELMQIFRDHTVDHASCNDSLDSQVLGAVNAQIHHATHHDVIAFYAGTLFEDDEFRDDAIRARGQRDYDEARAAFRSLSPQDKRELRAFAAAVARGEHIEPHQTSGPPPLPKQSSRHGSLVAYIAALACLFFITTPAALATWVPLLGADSAGEEIQIRHAQGMILLLFIAVPTLCIWPLLAKPYRFLPRSTFLAIITTGILHSILAYVAYEFVR